MFAKVNSGPALCRSVALNALVSAAAWLGWPGTALADVGDSFLTIPGISGHYKGAEHNGAIRAEADVWSINAAALGMGGYTGAIVPGPKAPPPGKPAKLDLMLSKTNPDAAALMKLCTSKTTIPELTFSEPWGRTRLATSPAFLEYKLHNVQITECPVLDSAPAQGFVLSFQDIAWLNFTPPLTRPSPYGGRGPIPGDTASVEPAQPAGGTKVTSYLVTWLGIATDSDPSACPVMNAKPTEDDFYRYRSPAEVAATKQRLGEKGVGASAFSEWRGPGNMNAVLLPGIVPDPGLHEPQSQVADGLNLDGDDGRGKPPRGIRKHKNYTAPDGRTGIDNQLYTVLGCIPGFRGKSGYRIQTDNARRADGNIVTLIEISGIRDGKNDRNVEVALIHARDKPIRDVVGKVFLPNYSYRPTDDPRFAHYNVRVKAHIVNGIVETDVIPKLAINSGQGPIYDLYQARMRIAPAANGGVKVMLGGYLDWRYYSTFMASGYSEGLFGYQQPAVYDALKRNADGLYNAATGEYDGISAAYELDGIPAFLTLTPKLAAH